MRAAAAIAALATLAAAAGCANTLMPTPVGFDASGADPFAATPAGARTADVRIFVAANRKVRDAGDHAARPPQEAAPPPSPGTYFRTERSQGMRLGTMSVRIGDGSVSWPALERVSREDDRTGDPEVRLEAIDDFGGVWIGPPGLDPAPDAGRPVAERFVAAVDEALASTGSRQVYVFVHGFNTTVADNAAVSASLFHYLGRTGAFVQFEWPSKGSVWAYQADRTAASASVRAFRHFIARLGERTKAERIHVIAHSAGAPVAVAALHELRLMTSGQPAEAARATLKIGRLVLVAPDMDLGEFRDCVSDGTTALPERVTIYVSSRDKALDFSAWMTDFARLGQPLQALTPAQVEFLEDDANVDIVDVAAAEERVGSWLGHSYFHEDPWVSTDVLLVLGTGAHPLDRGLQRDGTRKSYSFGDRYPDRAREAARRILASPAAAPAPARTDPSLTPSP
jgi:pimeloyl-ACP methyl ester carboxylesterase